MLEKWAGKRDMRGAGLYEVRGEATAERRGTKAHTQGTGGRVPENTREGAHWKGGGGPVAVRELRHIADPVVALTTMHRT